jgi:hypothetical protein
MYGCFENLVGANTTHLQCINGHWVRALHYIRMGVWSVLYYSRWLQAGYVNTVLDSPAALQNLDFNSVVLVQVKSPADELSNFVFVVDCFPSDY